MDEVALILRVIIIVLFSASTAVSLYAYKKRSCTYHLVGVAVWCIHVIGFTAVATLVAYKVLTITPEWLNIWSNAVRFHGGLVALSLAVYYATKPKNIVL